MNVHYVGISGATPDPAGRTSVCTGDFCNASASSCTNGLLVPFESKSIRDCIDGTSNVLIVAEQSGRVNNVDRSANGLGAYHGVANNPWTAATPMPFTAVATGTYPGGITTVRFAPNAFRAVSPTGPGQATTAYSFNTVTNSMHAGGIYGLLADGSVRFISENVNLPTFLQLCSRDDGMVLGEY